MSYRKFVSWFKKRVFDGNWDLCEAVYCTDVIRKIDSLPFWKRKREWLKVKEKTETIVSNINTKIEE